MWIRLPLWLRKLRGPGAATPPVVAMKVRHLGRCGPIVVGETDAETNILLKPGEEADVPENIAEILVERGDCEYVEGE